MRKAQRLEHEARDQWPTLRDLIVCYFHEDWVYRSQTVENVVAELTEVETLDRRKAGAREWWSANSKVAWKSDFDTILIDGFGFNQDFKDSDEARTYWNRTYDALITGIRKEEEGWKP